MCLSACTVLPLFGIPNLIVGCILGIAFMLSIFGILVTSLQLGLDQMPDASSTSITSFIAWHFFGFYAASWLTSALWDSESFCTDSKKKPIWHTQLCSLIPPFCLSIILILDFVWGRRKWLIIEPKSPQSFKTIYQVLKFAWKHKSPLNRSALTYWEEDIPSRMDLGKSRYGGPFTTEQVEDVKTILRLIPLCLTLGLLGTTLITFSPPKATFVQIPGWDTCKNRLLKVLTYDYTMWAVLWTVFYEFLIYPIIRNRLPSILKRIGIVSFLITVFSFVFLTLEIAIHYHNDIKAISTVLIVLQVSTKGVLSCLLGTTMLEFICAQAPYNMRGMFGGWILFTMVCSASLRSLTKISLTLYEINAGICLISFVLYCLLARWYKRRVRDEEYNVHRVVEEIYDRYLSARN